MFFTTCLLHTLSYNEITSPMIQFQCKLLQAQNSKKNRTFGYGKYKISLQSFILIIAITFKISFKKKEKKCTEGL